MSRVVYVNGRYRPYAAAEVHVEDRGFQFADAVYEVIEVSGRNLVDATRHLARLERSLGELAIPMPMTLAALRHVIAEVVRRNRVTQGIVYLQVTRGSAPRDFPFSATTLTPTLVCLARSQPIAKRLARAAAGIGVVTLPDLRWGRCDIKTVMLLPAVLAKETALAAGADEAWLVDRDGYVTEGASSNAWIVNADGQLQTRTLSPALLPGVTRRTTLDVAQALGIAVREAPFTVADALAASEAFNTSASGIVMPVVRIDGVKIAAGVPGPQSVRLRDAFYRYAERLPPAPGIPK